MRTHRERTFNLAEAKANSRLCMPVSLSRYLTRLQRISPSCLRQGLIVFTVFLAGAAWPATWYVDNAATGANNGTSWSNAWKSFSAVVWGTSGVKAGDTLFISGGSTQKIYTETWSVGASGAAGNPIRIAMDASNAAHNGSVIFDYDSAGDTASFVGISCNRNYVTFDGNVNGDSRMAINNLRNTGSPTACAALGGSGTTGVTIGYLSSTNCNIPVKMTSSTGFKIHHCNFRQVRGDAAVAAAGSSGTFDASTVCSNTFEMLFNNQPAGNDGPDGVQCGSGVSIFGNTFLETVTTVTTSSQHPDMVQAQGNFLKIYNNEFINIGDSALDFDCFANSATHDVWVYNNVFHIVTAIDPYPEYFRLYTSGAAITSISNFKICNNTFVDDNFQYRVLRFDMFGGNPTASGNEIKNNIFYNCGGGSSSTPIIYIANSTAFTSSSFSFDANIYYRPSGQQFIVFRGTNYTAPNWVAANEPKGKTNAVTFASYSAFSPNNEFHLQSADTAAKDAGVNLSAYFSADKDGKTRPQGPAWDIGAYEYGSTTNSRPQAPTNFRIVGTSS
jgi:hypothetical protein